MYIEAFKIRNLRSIAELEWNLGDRPREGWHVILGDNGSGKTTVVRGICLALLGYHNSKTLLAANWSSYLRTGTKDGLCEVRLTADSSFDLNPLRGISLKEFIPLANNPESADFVYDTYANTPNGGIFIRSIRFAIGTNGYIGGSSSDPSSEGVLDLADGLGSKSGNGWFSAAYGPFRRFTGGDREEEKRFLARPSAGRHMSVFYERVALTQPIDWLIGLHTGQLDTGKPSELLENIIRFVNQNDFLPNGVQLDHVSSKDVIFRDGEHNQVGIEDLSDGYRSVLCMTLELIRQLSIAYGDRPLFESGNDGIYVAVPGVVLIDEVDVHLHPSWQRTIGLWYRKHFPKMQFIVTTHSPLVCQAAEHGTVFALRSPDSEEESRFIEGAELEKLLYGDILDAYSTELFGPDVDRSPTAQKLLQRLAELNVAELERKLTKPEKEEQRELRRKLPTSAYAMHE